MDIALALLVAALLVVQFAGCALVLRRYLADRRAGRPEKLPPLTVLRPVCGADPDLERTLASSFSRRAAPCEVIFCVAGAADPAIPVIRDLIARQHDTGARLLIGDSPVSRNPKLNNLVKGWEAARHDWIVMIDSNVLLPADFKARLFASWKDDTGLVTAPPVGIEPAGLAASFECAFLNSYQDRWQLAADELGQGFAQGKVLMWHRDLLDAAGGPAALGLALAEDVAATRLVRAAGRKVRVVARPFAQPVGHRGLRDVWARQLRWARVRRAGFPALFALEPLTGALVPFLAALALVHAGTLPPAAVAAGVTAWYGAEWITARLAGWPAAPRDLLAWMLRDAAIPLLWGASLASRGFVWRGNAMAPGLLNGAPRPGGEIQP